MPILRQTNTLPELPDPNVLRHEYRALSDAEMQQVQRIKDLGLTFIEQLRLCGTSRELSLARTKIEEAVMWAVKGVSR